jgi:hypothetical protein
MSSLSYSLRHDSHGLSSSAAAAKLMGILSMPRD